MIWFGGRILIWKAHQVGAQLAVVAARLGARVIGDDSDEYHPDGSIVRWSRSQPRPELSDRAWTVEETADAWERIFDRRLELGDSWHPGPGYARHALGAFRTFADHAVATADVSEPESLRYSYGPGEDAEGPVLALRLVRVLATDSLGGHARVTCRLDLPESEDLAGLGAYESSWPVPTSSASDAWFDAVAARTEWDLFDQAMPRTFGFELTHHQGDA
jgi:hypothetical protein